ncbi:MAG TPA: phosphoribosylanthranilate isomerase [Gammaproteobacteria bacterium]|nr:phosphoribosylanthranilate isomerase [Gammaproteobacteria bacterium]
MNTDRVRVKICGITRPEDGAEAGRLGADAIGLVFYPPSPRHVSLDTAQAVVAALPPFVTVVALFVNAAESEIRRVLAALPVGLIQFHGDEPPEECRRYGRPYLKALRMAPDTDVAANAARYGDAAGILLDSYQPGVPGGTGRTFQWARVPPLHCPLILAGGLTPDNVAQAIATVRPYGVDVSGGVEREKGIKDAARMADFIARVRAVESRGQETETKSET